MPNYRADQFIALIKSIDARKNDDDDPMLLDENTIQDRFFPLSEKLSLADAVTIAYFVPSTFVWGDGPRPITLQSALSDWSTSTASGVDLSA